MNENEADRPDALTSLMGNDGKPPATEPKPPLLFSKRFFVVILLFVSNVNVILLENNGNLAVIEMTSEKFAPNGSFVRSAEFQWDSKTIGFVLSAFSYGKLLSFLSGLFICRLGGSTCWALSLFISGILTILQPIGLRYHFCSFLACRFTAGVFHSFSVASYNEIFSHWIPKCERGIMLSIFLNGAYIGLAIVHPLCGFIASEWGWPMVFYSTGIASSMFSFFCIIVVRNRPSEDKWISKKELSYIHQETEVTSSKEVISHPYKKMLTSKPVWAVFILNWITNSVVSILVTSLPLFVKDSTRKGTKEVAFIAAIPNVVVFFVSLFAGTLLDFWRKRSSISQTKMHKICIGVALLSQMMLFLGLTLVHDLIMTITIFVIIRVLLPFVLIVLYLITFSLAPNHSGLLAGFATFWYSLGAITTQTVTGFLTTNHSLDEWNRCFLLAAAMLLFGTVTFVVYGSSEAQPWSLTSHVGEQPPNPLQKCTR